MIASDFEVKDVNVCVRYTHASLFIHVWQNNAILKIPFKFFEEYLRGVKPVLMIQLWINYYFKSSLKTKTYLQFWVNGMQCNEEH